MLHNLLENIRWPHAGRTQDIISKPLHKTKNHWETRSSKRRAEIVWPEARTAVHRQARPKPPVLPQRQRRPLRESPEMADFVYWFGIGFWFIEFKNRLLVTSDPFSLSSKTFSSKSQRSRTASQTEEGCGKPSDACFNNIACRAVKSRKNNKLINVYSIGDCKDHRNQ